MGHLVPHSCKLTGGGSGELGMVTSIRIVHAVEGRLFPSFTALGPSFPAAPHGVWSGEM